MTFYSRPAPEARRSTPPMTRANLPLSSIVICKDVLARIYSELEHRHVREMADTVRRTGKLDDLLVWLEEDHEGKPTGRYVLLDGEHRIAAYQTAWGRTAKDRKVPVGVFKGSRMEAQLRAIAANVRRKLGLSKAQRMDRAWQLVWEHGYALSKERLAGAAHIGVSTVGKLRKRWTEMKAAGDEPTGEWWRDSRPMAEDWTADVPQARKDAINALLPELRKQLRRKPQLPTEYLVEVLKALLGDHALYHVIDALTEDTGEDIEPAEIDPDSDY